MSIVVLDSQYILERIRSIAISVDADFWDESQFYRHKRSVHISALLYQAKLSEIVPAIVTAIVEGVHNKVQLESMHFYELMRLSRQFYTQMVLDTNHHYQFTRKVS